jgi:hypothetical protein
MNSNELTFNELAPQDLLLVDWSSIDLEDYPGDYTQDVEVCFKLQIWKLQCKFGTLVNKYINNLIYGINCEELFVTLFRFKLGLEILQKYDPRDITTNTTDYNSLTYNTIIKIIEKLNSY